MAARGRIPKHVLVLDIGGTYVKWQLDARGAVGRFTSGPKMSPKHMMRKLLARTATLRYDAVSVGYPGLVFRSRIVAEPHNLGGGWVGFDFGKAFGKPVRLINDAAMQAIGSYRGGRMLFVGLGTGLGAALILDGVVEPTEIGHMLYKHGYTFEDYLGERGRRRLGNAKWRRRVEKVIEQLRFAFEVEYLVIGGGNAQRIKHLPSYARRGANRNAFLGGVRLWGRGGMQVHVPGVGAPARR